MTREETIEYWMEKIPTMSQMDMARELRFAPAGCPLFSTDYPLYMVFKKRFDELGGMTPEISRRIGF